MAIRFSFEDNFIGCIYSNRRLIWNKIVNKQRPLPHPPEKEPRPDAANTKSDQQNPAVYWVLSVSCGFNASSCFNFNTSFLVMQAVSFLFYFQPVPGGPWKSTVENVLTKMNDGQTGS